MKSLDDIRLATSNGTTKKLSKKARVRVMKVVDLIRTGHSKQRCLEILSEEEHISSVQSNIYYNAALDYLKPTDEEANQLRDEVNQTLRTMIEDCIKSGDKTTALKALDQLNKMGGLYETNINAKISSDIKINFDIDTEPDNEDNGEND